MHDRNQLNAVNRRQLFGVAPRLILTVDRQRAYYGSNLERLKTLKLRSIGQLPSVLSGPSHLVTHDGHSDGTSWHDMNRTSSRFDQSAAKRISSTRRRRIKEKPHER